MGGEDGFAGDRDFLRKAKKLSEDVIREDAHLCGLRKSAVLEGHGREVQGPTYGSDLKDEDWNGLCSPELRTEGVSPELLPAW